VRAFAIGVTLNLAFVIVEAVFEVFAHSLALVAVASQIWDRAFDDPTGARCTGLRAKSG
jgi:hypothetical protein